MQEIKKVIESNQDSSVNFIESKQIGFTEARYVRRKQDYFIVYLSSQTGCAKGCNFCHLTTTGQTSFQNVTPNEYLSQAQSVMQHYISKIPEHGKARTVHYNWMSRGEALANPHMLNDAFKILTDLTNLSIQNNLIPKFNVSTIMPREMNRRELSSLFPGITPTIYYSLYSMNPDFRKRWMPSAMDPEKALDKLAQYQSDTKKIIKLHWAFIKGENDNLDTLGTICDAVKARNLRVDFNLVRYNPYSSMQGEESSEETLQRNIKFLKDELGSNTKSQIVSRVGFDVKASCGMFVENI